MRKSLLAATLCSLLCATLLPASAANAQDAAAPPAAAPADPGATPAPKKKKRKAKAPAADAAAPDAAAATPAAPAAPDAAAKPTKKKGKRGKKGKAAPAPDAGLAPPPGTTLVVPAPPPAPAPTVIIVPPAPAPAAAPAPAPAPAEEFSTGPADDDPPVIVHTPVGTAVRNHPLAVTAHITDASGVFQPLLRLRRHGSGDYIPIKMSPSKAKPDEFIAEIPDKLVSVDLDYYVEAWDNAGNHATVGVPETPLIIKVEDEKKPVVIIGSAKPKGVPPSITHAAVARAVKAQSIEIAAKLVGETGISSPTVLFRHVGEKDFKSLPMGDIGGGDFTATIPGSLATEDIEYYLEAFDKEGNGPGRSGGPGAPYLIKVAEAPPPTPVPVPGVATPGPAAAPGTGVAEAPAPALQKPRYTPPPFSPNPGRAFGWVFMTGFVGAEVFAGGYAYGAWSADDTYHHTFSADGRLVPELHQRSVDYSDRAKKFAIVGGASLVVSIVLLLVFPEHASAAGSGGDAPGIRF